MKNGKKTKSLSQWCVENVRSDIIAELDCEKNAEVYAEGYIPNRIEYNSSRIIGWICENGHKYRCEVVGRTLFGLKCPICNPKNATLPVGTKYGCLTIIGDFDNYQVEVVEPKIRELRKEKEDFLKGIRKPNSNIDSEDFFERRIEDYRMRQLYKCQCDCGKKHFFDQQFFLQTRHRFCSEGVTEKGLENLSWTKKVKKEPYCEEDILKEYCGLAVKAWKDKQKKYKENGRRKFANNYDLDLTGNIFESLEVLECINDNYEERCAQGDLRKKDAYSYMIYKLYKCRCYLCGKEHMVKCSQFHISPPTQYGVTAYHGYWSGIECGCHEISSFQWIVNKLLLENDIDYRVEYFFSDLFGYYGTNRLKFDFAIMNKDGSVKCLIECQGEQHYMPVKEFGGNRQYDVQVKNDELKKAYVQKHNIELIEISYKDKKIEKVETILRKHNII